jgi:hypothetical protein
MPQGGGQPGFGGGAGGRGGGFGGGNGAMTFAGSQTQTLSTALIDYLLAHQGGARFLVATTTSSYASLFILQTNKPAMALGGYQGWDRILTPTQLAAAVANNTVRYFYISAGRGAQFSRFGSQPTQRATGTTTGATGTTTGAASTTTGAASTTTGAASTTTGAASTAGTSQLPGDSDATGDLTAWVEAHCSAVPSTEYAGTTSTGAGGDGRGGMGGGLQLYSCASLVKK